MTAIEAPGPDAAVDDQVSDTDTGTDDLTPGGTAARPAAVASDRLIVVLAYGLTLVPFVVAALALLLAVGGEYHPFSDHALTEMQTRSVARDEVLVGLYSRDEWNHPGPALFYVLAPFYWLTGGMSVGISVGALAVNGASVAGMGLIARRRGGTPLLLVTLLANALLMRMLGAAFLQDPWNCFVTTLPFGVLVLLSWSMWRGDAWALPAGVAVASFLAQSHVGFAALAPPLVVWGLVGLVASAVRQDDEHRRGALRRSVRAALLAGGVGLVVWAPTIVEALRYSPGNVEEIVRYFRHPEESTHSLVEGWRVMSGPFGGALEWLTTKREFGFAGQSPYITGAPLPWMLALVAVAGFVLWRRRVHGTFSLLATLGLTFVVGMVAVARTIGLAFDYRLRWTYIPALVGAMVVGWGGWTAVTARWPRAGSQVLTPLALGALALLSGVNVFTAATVGTPQQDDSAAVASLTDQVLDHLPDDLDGSVLIGDAYHSGAWHARGLVLQLERRGIDTGVEGSLANEYGRHRVIAGPDEVGVALVVTRDEFVDSVAERPGLRPIAEWYSLPQDEIDELLAERRQVEADFEAGRITLRESVDLDADISRRLTNDEASTAWRAVVFVDEGYGEPVADP